MRSFVRGVAVFAMCIFTTSIVWAQFNSTRPRDGACFFTDFNFRGESFCMQPGQNAASMPSGFNDRIRSIRVFGRARVQFFNDSNFRGINSYTDRDISDLRRLPLADNRDKNWAVRISSIQIEGGGYGGGGRDRDDRGGWWSGRDRDNDRDRDDDRDRDGWHSESQTVSCSSDTRRDKQWCRTPGRVNRVRVVNQSGRANCEYNRTFGIDNGRLWTGRGCSGTFEVR